MGQRYSIGANETGVIAKADHQRRGIPRDNKHVAMVMNECRKSIGPFNCSKDRFCGFSWRKAGIKGLDEEMRQYLTVGVAGKEMTCLFQTGTQMAMIFDYPIMNDHHTFSSDMRMRETWRRSANEWPPSSAPISRPRQS